VTEGAAAPSSARGARRAAGIAALVALCGLGAAIATAGPEVVPGAGRGEAPSWVLGAFGEGIGLDGGAVIHLERAALAAYVVVLVCARALSARLLWSVITGLTALFVLAPPLLSLDVFSYVAYSRLEGVHGLNPYEVGPAAAPGDESLPFIEDWREKVSVYGPLFTLLTLPLSALSVAAAVWSLKALAGAAVLAIAWILFRLAPMRGVDPRFAAAFVPLNPLVLVHVVGGAHNDAVMAALMTAAVAAIVLARPVLGGFGVAAAAAAKASAAVLAPFALIGAERRGRFALGLLLGAIAIGGVGLAVFGTAIDEALKVGGQSQSVATRASLPATISRETGLDLDLLRTVSLALWIVALAGLLAWTARGADWIRAVGWASVGLLAATSYLTPWYAIWALPHVALARDRVLVVVTVLLSAFLLYQQVPGLGG
jgi:hypothetical protein